MRRSHGCDSALWWAEPEPGSSDVTAASRIPGRLDFFPEFLASGERFCQEELFFPEIPLLCGSPGQFSGLGHYMKHEET